MNEWLMKRICKERGYTVTNPIRFNFFSYFVLDDDCKLGWSLVATTTNTKKLGFQKKEEICGRLFNPITAAPVDMILIGPAL